MLGLRCVTENSMRLFKASHGMNHRNPGPEKAQSIRVLVVTRERSADRRYGLGKSLEPVLAALEQQGVEYHYLTQDDAGQRGWELLRRVHQWLTRWLQPVLRGTEVAGVVWGVLERANMGRLAAKVALAEGWTHVHCHDPLIAWGLRWSLRWRGRSAQIRWGVTEHGFGCYAQAIHEDGARLGRHVMNGMRQLETRVLLAADWVICPTHLAQAQLRRDLALPQVPVNFYVIPHPAPRLDFPDQSTARKEFGWADQEWVWLAVGRLAPLKAFDLLVRAFAQLVGRTSVPQRLHIAGGGDTTPLLALASALDVADRVSIGETDQIGRYYAAANAYISTSRTESFGMANLEALAAGLPVLATAAGGVPEVLGDAAVLMPIDAPEVWAALMQRLVENTDECQRWSRSALERVRRWPDAGEVARACLAVYAGESVPEVRPPPSPTIILPSHPPLFRVIEPLCLDGVSRVLVLAPHADDETMGCGGLIALLTRRGVLVQVCFISDGRLGDPEARMAGDTVARRTAEARKAAIALGSLPPRFMGLPDGELSEVGDLSARMAAEIADFKPDCIVLPDESDAHADHVAVARAGQRLLQRTTRRARVLCYEIWTPLPVNRLLDVSEVFDKKIEALTCYELPLSYVDYLAAARGLAQYRGIHLPEGRGLAEGYLELSCGAMC